MLTRCRLTALAMAGSLAGMLACGSAHAQVTVDPNIFVSNSTSVTGGDPNIITSTSSNSIFVGEIGGGQSNEQNPLLLILAIYDGLTPGGTPSITFTPPSPATGCPTSGCPLAMVGTYGLNANPGTISSGDVYETLGLLGMGKGSASFTNMSMADVANGFFAPTSFTLDVFAIPTGLTPNTSISIGESGAANGSFLFAFDCESPDPSFSACSGGSVGATPFTTSGLIDAPGGKVPEPASLALFGTALAGLGLLGRRRRKNV